MWSLIGTYCLREWSQIWKLYSWAQNVRLIFCKGNRMIFLVQFGINVHGKIFQKLTKLPVGECHWQVHIYSKLYERKLWVYLLSNQMTSERKQEKVKHKKKFIQLIGWSAVQCLSNSKFNKSKIFKIIQLWTHTCVLFLNYPNIFEQNIFTCSCVLVLTIFVSLRKPNSYFLKIPAILFSTS